MCKEDGRSVRINSVGTKPVFKHRWMFLKSYQTVASSLLAMVLICRSGPSVCICVFSEAMRFIGVCSRLTPSTNWRLGIAGMEDAP